MHAIADGVARRVRGQRARRDAADAAGPRRLAVRRGRTGLVACRAVTEPATLLRAHLRVPDERARLRAHRRAARGRRPGAGRPTSTTPTSSCSTPAASGRTPTTSSTAHLGHLKSLKDRAPEHADRGRRLPGPEGPRRRSASGRRTSTWCSAPTTCTGPPTCCTQAAADGPDHRDPRGDGRRRRRRLPLGAAGPPRGRPTRRGSRSRSAATTAARSASCPRCGARRSAGPFDDIVDEVERLAADGVTEVTLLGQNVNTYGRDLTLAARQAGGSDRVRPLFAELLRAVGAVDGIRRVRYTSPHPKDLRPETIAAMAETPAVCEHLHLPAAVGQRPGAGRHAPRLHRRALPRAAGRGPRRPSPTWPSPPTSSWASPARPTTTSSAPSRWPPRPSTTAPTRSSTRPGPGTEAAERVDELRRPPTSSPSASSGCGSWSSARRLAKHEARVGRVEEVAGRGPEPQGPGGRSPAAPARTSSCTSPSTGPLPAGHLRRRARHRRRRRTTCAASWSTVTAPPRHRTRIPVLGRLIAAHRAGRIDEVPAARVSVQEPRPSARTEPTPPRLRRDGESSSDDDRTSPPSRRASCSPRSRPGRGSSRRCAADGGRGCDAVDAGSSPTGTCRAASTAMSPRRARRRRDAAVTPLRLGRRSEEVDDELGVTGRRGRSSVDAAPGDGLGSAYRACYRPRRSASAPHRASVPPDVPATSSPQCACASPHGPCVAGGAVTTRRATSRSSGPPRRASRRWPSSWPGRARRRRARVGRLDAGVPGHGHRHGQADAGRAGRGAAPPARPGRPVGGLHGRLVPGRRRATRSPTSSDGASRALLVGGTGLYLRAVVDDLDDPRAVPRGAAPSSRPSPTPRAPPRAGSPSSTRVAAARMEPTNRRRVVRALEVTSAAAGRSRRYGPGLDDLPADRRSAWSGSRLPRDGRSTPASSDRYASSWPPGSSTRSGALAARPAACRRTAAPGARLQGAARPPRRRGAALDEARRPGRPPHPPLRPPPAGVVPPRPPRSRWLRRRRRTRSPSLARRCWDDWS